MKGGDPKQPVLPTAEHPPNSGEGADTALEAMLRRRRQAEHPDQAVDPGVDPVPPLPPACQARP